MDASANNNNPDAKPVKPDMPVMLNLTVLAARLSATRESVAKMVHDGGFPIDAKTPSGDPLWFEASLPALRKIWHDDCRRFGSESRMRKAGLL